MKINSTSPDVSMLMRDFVKNKMDLHDLQISSKIRSVVNRKINYDDYNSLLLSSVEGEKDNIYYLRKFVGIKLNPESLGVSKYHLNIFIGNVAGCMSPTAYLMAFAALTILYYIIQIILSFFYFKPKKKTRPNIHSIIIFYFGIAILLISISFYFCSYRGINSFYYTFYNFNETCPIILNSIYDSFMSIAKVGIPNAVGPLVYTFKNISGETSNYVFSLTRSFIDPTTGILENLISENESNLGIFPIYNTKIRPTADKFYDHASKYPKLKDLPIFFNMTNFTEIQNTIQNLLDAELAFANRIQRINLFFNYFNSTIVPFQQYVYNLTNQRINNHYETVGNFIQKISNGQLKNFKLVYELEKATHKDYTIYRIVRIIFFVFGAIFILITIFYSIVFNMRNKFSLCIANSISIFPIIATIIICFFNFIMTSVGYTDYEFSQQIEFALDSMLSSIIDVIIPGREIQFYPIDMSYYTDGEFHGILNLSNIVFPEKMTNIKHFSESQGKTGIADAFDFQSIINMTQYGDEIGDFIIDVGHNFSLSEKTIQLFNQCQQYLQYALLLPKSIDGLFNWGVPMTISADILRMEIERLDPIALIELNPYLVEIEYYSHLMNERYGHAISLITGNLSDSLLHFNDHLQNYVRRIMNDTGSEVKRLSREVYPVLNEIKSESLIGPYALIRNALFYDISDCSTFLSISGMCLMIGFPFIVTLMWIRRKGMLVESANDSEIDLHSVGSNKGTVNNNNSHNNSHNTSDKIIWKDFF